MIFLVTNKGKA